MIFIPGIVIAIFTFPGIIVHEAAHQFMCRLTGTPVLEVCYFQLETPFGYVRHLPANSPRKMFLICVAPLLFNTALAMLLTLPVTLASMGKMWMQPQDILLGWVGFSIGMHAFPSSGDANVLWTAMQAPGTPPHLKRVGIPVAALIKLASAARIVWFDFFYASAICAIPGMLVALFA